MAPRNQSPSPRSSKISAAYPSNNRISVHSSSIKQDHDELSEVSEFAYNGSICSDCAAIWRVVLVLLILSCLIFFTVDMFTTQYTIHFLEWFVQQVENMNPVWLILLVTAFTAIAAMIAFPFVLLAMSGAYLLCYRLGLAWGISIAILTNDLGTCLGAAMTFKLSQTVFRPYILEISSSHKFIRGFEGALKKKGFWINFLLRISPILPTVLMNYTIPAMGATFGSYILGCFCGTLVYSIILSVLGGMLSNINSIVTFVTETPLYVTLTSSICGVVFIIACTWILFKYSHEALEEACEAEADDVVYDGAPYRTAEYRESDPLLHRVQKHII